MPSEDYIYYEIGDRIVVIKDYPDDNENIRVGMTGTIAGERAFNGWYAVNYDEDINGYACNSRCEDGHGWQTPSWYFAPLAQEDDSELDISEEPDALDFLCG